jgi:hypothetical protein
MFRPIWAIFRYHVYKNVKRTAACNTNDIVAYKGVFIYFLFILVKTAMILRKESVFSARVSSVFCKLHQRIPSAVQEMTVINRSMTALKTSCSHKAVLRRFQSVISFILKTEDLSASAYQSSYQFTRRHTQEYRNDSICHLHTFNSHIIMFFLHIN